ncbi:Alg9-like mannosyltransferase family-domain-containing protein [Podospora appendiculata]|uniref:Mannosyltransferase n=1 Tax=Podospora appendiculata TaxID=314037 RepID=A0AAE0XIG2_9PEZI|nr:Alg9-like mannosyltransferase family-domain-containing protein [Podospora appendiculata]
MKLLDAGLSLFIPGLVIAHLILAPYTKVEESFNIQAAHDVLVYGMPTVVINQKLSNTYDHFTFSGVVPRTFLGPVLLAGIAQPIIAVVGFNHAQFVVRAVLGLFNAACLLVFARSIRRAYGVATARWYLLLQASQFHIMFYASRTLPNMFAFGLTTLAFAFLIPDPNPKAIVPRQRLAIVMLVFAAVVFRSEIALLLATTILHLLILPSTSLGRVIPPFAISFLAALVISVPLDSYFWQKPLWPELWGFYYNAVLGSSSAWGVSPFHYYFTSALPRLLLNPLTYTVLIPLALRHPALAPSATRLIVPSLLFVAIYSLQPHKEARFIFYVVPPLTAAAALGANLVFNHRGKSALSAVLALALVASVALSFVASTGMLLLSSLNYPGGEALAFLRETVQASEASSASSALVPAHADVLACMTGVTLFGTAIGSAAPSLGVSKGNLICKRQTGAEHGGVSLVLDKTEDEAVLAQGEFWRRFDYVLAEDTAKVRGGAWEAIGVVKGYAGVEFQLSGKGGQGVDEEAETPPVVGRGAAVARWKRRVRALTGGRWVGPRMVPRIYILKRIKDGERLRKTVGA